MSGSGYEFDDSSERWLYVVAPMDGKCRGAIGNQVHELDGTFEITRIKRIHIDGPPYVNYQVYGIPLS